MPISALPQETVRLLGSPLVYSSPISVVKELVDNALDAHATSVEVLISADTVDRVEVRDNGHGIHPVDFNTLGHRGCTSKLRTFEDIQTVGSVTLGFRGDALASATTVGTLSIVTRTAGEPTASRLLFSEKGGVGKIERVSGPVGTAVKVTQIFARLPVRKQCALKEAAQTIPKIKDLLHAYAFARPHVKLAFKVLNQPKASWSYAPGPHPGIGQAALQIFGAELVSQCVGKTKDSPEDAPGKKPVGIFTVQSQGSYTIDALLPTTNADPAKISKGAWFSIDSRPVSSTKSTMKTLYSAFKEHLKRHRESAGSNTTLKNPFLAVNIRCPAKSYDPNVEPSKDEVLFANSPRLVETFERLLDEVYATLVESNGQDGGERARLTAIPPRHPSRAARHRDEGSQLLSPEQTPGADTSIPLGPDADTPDNSWIEGLLPNTDPSAPRMSPTSPRMTVMDLQALGQGAQASQASHYKSPPSSGDPEPSRGPGANPFRNLLADDDPPWMSRGRKMGPSAHGGDDNANVSRPQGSRDNRQVEQVPGDTHLPHVEGINPWVLAKFARNRNQAVQIPAQHVREIRLPHSLSPARAFNVEALQDRAVPMQKFQQTRLTRGEPPPAVVSPEAHPQRAFPGPCPAASPVQEAFMQNYRSPMPASQLRAPGVPGGAFRSPMAYSDSDPTQRVQRQRSRHRGPSGFVPPFAHGVRVVRPPCGGGGGAHRQPPRDEPDNNWFQTPPDSSAGRSNRRQRDAPGAGHGSNVDGYGQLRLSNDDLRGQMRLSNVDPGRHIRLSTEEQPEVSNDLAAIRQRLAVNQIRRLRDQQAGRVDRSEQPERTGEVVPCMDGRVQGRQAQPGGLPNNTTTTRTGLPAGDPRAFLMQRTCSLPSTTPRKLRRIKSCMLPLETTPAGEETHNLKQTVHVDVLQLYQSLETQHNNLLPYGSVNNVLVHNITPDGLRLVQQHVLRLLSELGYTGQEGNYQIEFHPLQQVTKEQRQIEAGV